MSIDSTKYEPIAYANKEFDLAPFAWATFDGEGGYDLRLYDPDENYRDDYIARNGEKYANWVLPLYAKSSKAEGEPVAYANREHLAELQFCNGTSVWCESPSMWGAKELAPPHPSTLVPVYLTCAPKESLVTSILLDVTPGDGSGHFVYAKTAQDVVNKLSELGDKIDELEQTIRQLRTMRAASPDCSIRWKSQKHVL